MFDNTKKTVLITGAGGFIGHHFVEHYLTTTDWNLILLDSFRHKGMTSRLSDVLLSIGRSNVEMNPFNRVAIFTHDLKAPVDQVLIQRIGKISSGKLDVIINLASNSAVGRSLEDARECWENNCALIINMLEFSRHTNNAGGKPLFIQISTDEVYGPKNNDGHKEWDTIMPSNPYSASKAAQEALCYAYWKSFGLPIIIVNTMNNFGERQDPEKFIPRMVSLILQNKVVPIFTDEEGIIGTRCYLHCKDHAEAIKLLIEYHSKDHEDKSGPYYSRLPRYNVCGSAEYNNLTMAHLINNIISDTNQLKYSLLKPKEVRPGYDKSYGLDNKKMKTIIGWEPPVSIEKRLREVVQWTVANQEWLKI